jgi:RHS repeat-associated protein
MEYGGTGRLHKLTEPDGQTWRFKYTPGEKLRGIENPRGEVYELAYDTAGRVVTETTFDGRVLKYSYSPAGKVNRVDYPDGSFRAFEHDVLGNAVREESRDGPISFQRDTMGRLLGATLEQDGRKVVTLFERDRLGRIVAEEQDGQRVLYETDALGRRTSRTMPDGSVTRYQYDALGELIGLSHGGHEVTFERDVLGREAARRDAAGKVRIVREYDSMDRIIEQRAEVRVPGGGAPTIAVQRLWQYDDLGRMKQVEDRRWGSTRYRYDSIGQLLEAERGGRRELFSYDATGAIQKMLAGIEGSAKEPGEEAEPWLLEKGSLLRRADEIVYSYDRRGRRVAKEEGSGPRAQRTQYTWDCRDRLREVRLHSGKKVSFIYDAFGRRTRKEVHDEDGELLQAVDFLWEGDVLAADIDARHGTRTFVHAPGTFVPLLQEERGEVFSYTVDQVGVPKELIDRTGRVAWSAAHSAWGRVVETYVDPERAKRGRRPVQSPFRLLGQYADEETGLCYTRFRYFDAEVGRWCSPDPLGIWGGNNLFAFDGAPTIVADPLGLQSDLPPLAQVPYVASYGDELVAMSKPSTKDKLFQTHTYVNPGHHDPTSVNYKANRSVLPPNHVELFEQSVPVVDKNGKVTRWAKEGTGKGAVYHRFQPHVSGEFHWNGSTNGVTKSGHSRVIDINHVPGCVR